jgi:septum formation protein
MEQSAAGFAPRFERPATGFAHRIERAATVRAVAETRPPRLVLASSSPRRRELLAGAGLRFEIQHADIDETYRGDEEAGAYAARLAREKALAVAGRLNRNGASAVLGADTIVVLDDAILGKPEDDAHAEILLGRLVGRTHRVITAVAVVSADARDVRALQVESRVTMRPASREEIRAYVALGESRDKAGGYAVQGEGRRLVERVEGSESNVIGLPLDETLALLRELGVAKGAA